jgi:hypothetical protein
MNKQGIDASWQARLRSGAQQPARACESHTGLPVGEAVEAAPAVSDISAAWPRGNGLTAQSWRLYG